MITGSKLTKGKPIFTVKNIAVYNTNFADLSNCYSTIAIK